MGEIDNKNYLKCKCGKYISNRKWMYCPQCGREIQKGNTTNGKSKKDKLD